MVSNGASTCMKKVPKVGGLTLPPIGCVKVNHLCDKQQILIFWGIKLDCLFLIDGILYFSVRRK